MPRPSYRHPKVVTNPIAPIVPNPPPALPQLPPALPQLPPAPPPTPTFLTDGTVEVGQHLIPNNNQAP